MVNKKRYRESMDLSPPTAWTQIAKAGDPSSPECRKSLDELIALYDRPLLVLFEAIAETAPGQTEDWKQDFIVSHLLSGRVFQAARPIGSFRTFLAVCVHNYVTNCYARDAAKKRRASEGAVPFSQKGDEDKDAFESSLPAPEEAAFYENILSRARAWDIFRGAVDELEEWVKSQENAKEMMAVVTVLRSDSGTLTSLDGKSVSVKVAIERLKDSLRRLVREELLIESGEDEEEIVGREGKLLRDACSGHRGWEP